MRKAETLGQKPAEVLAHGLSRLTPWDISGRWVWTS